MFSDKNQILLFIKARSVQNLQSFILYVLFVKMLAKINLLTIFQWIAESILIWVIIFTTIEALLQEGH